MTQVVEDAQALQPGAGLDAVPIADQVRQGIPGLLLRMTQKLPSARRIPSSTLTAGVVSGTLGLNYRLSNEAVNDRHEHHRMRLGNASVTILR